MLLLSRSACSLTVDVDADVDVLVTESRGVQTNTMVAMVSSRRAYPPPRFFFLCASFPDADGQGASAFPSPAFIPGVSIQQSALLRKC